MKSNLPPPPPPPPPAQLPHQQPLLPQAQPQISAKIIVDELRPLLQEQSHSVMGDGGVLNRLATRLRKKVKSTLGLGGGGKHPKNRNGFPCHLFHLKFHDKSLNLASTKLSKKHS